jgi:hypothetical protein
VAEPHHLQAVTRGEKQATQAARLGSLFFFPGSTRRKPASGKLCVVKSNQSISPQERTPHEIKKTYGCR